MPRNREKTACAALAILLLSAAGCGGSPCGEGEDLCCGGVPATILQSRIDDDDGDGNPYDEDFPRIDDEDDDIADHAWIADDCGLYHLFFQTEERGAGSRIEHYVSPDLRHLDYVGTALSPNPAGWDSYALWAPHVVRAGHRFYMFYTGTDGPGGDPAAAQRIGLAVSRDLMHWTRVEVNNCPGTWGNGCIYECVECWTAWKRPPGEYNRQCRDPFVIWDRTGRRWLMFATAKSTNDFGVVTVARSSDLAHWTGVGFIDATRRLADGAGAQATGGQAENPFVASRGGMHYLFFTDWEDPEDSVATPNPRTIVQFAASRTLDVDTLGSANWIYRGYIPDPGVNAIEIFELGRGDWIMSQSISNVHSGLWPFRRRLRLRCVLWEGDLAFSTANPDFECRARGNPPLPLAVYPLRTY